MKKRFAWVGDPNSGVRGVDILHADTEDEAREIARGVLRTSWAQSELGWTEEQIQGAIDEAMENATIEEIVNEWPARRFYAWGFTKEEIAWELIDDLDEKDGMAFMTDDEREAVMGWIADHMTDEQAQEFVNKTLENEQDFLGEIYGRSGYYDRMIGIASETLMELGFKTEGGE